MQEPMQVAELISYGITPEEVFLDGLALRNYEITYRRIHGETLEEIAKDFGLTREAIRQVVQKTYGPGLDLALAQKKAEKKLAAKNSSYEIEEYILNHKGVRVSELLATFTETKPESIAELKPVVKKYVDFEREVKEYAEQWSNESILEALAKAGTYYFPLSRNDYEDLIKAGEIVGPSGALIMKRFGTWAIACSSAGIESHKTNLSYIKKWSEREQEQFVVEFLESPMAGSSMALYNSWKAKLNPHAPSSQLLRNTFGGWLEVISTGLRALREEWDNQNPLSRKIESIIEKVDDNETRY